MESLFSVWDEKLFKLRKNICTVLKDEDKEGMVKTVMGQSKMFLSLKFFLKDNNPKCLFE